MLNRNKTKMHLSRPYHTKSAIVELNYTPQMYTLVIHFNFQNYKLTYIYLNDNFRGKTITNTYITNYYIVMYRV